MPRGSGQSITSYPNDRRTRVVVQDNLVEVVDLELVRLDCCQHSRVIHGHLKIGRHARLLVMLVGAWPRQCPCQADDFQLVSEA